jgi:hypothetical protein
MTQTPVLLPIKEPLLTGRVGCDLIPSSIPFPIIGVSNQFYFPLLKIPQPPASQPTVGFWFEGMGDIWLPPDYLLG